MWAYHSGEERTFLAESRRDGWSMNIDAQRKSGDDI
jgi:hypothetical protein